MNQRKDFYITIIDGDRENLIVNLANFQKNTITFGREPNNDIPLRSSIVSRYHGYFMYNGDNWVIYDNNSTNGITWNQKKITHKRLLGGDKILIGYDKTGNKVAFLFSNESPQDVYNILPMDGKREICVSPFC